MQIIVYVGFRAKLSLPDWEIKKEREREIEKEAETVEYKND